MIKGLNPEELKQRIQNGQINKSNIKTEKSIKDIIFSNIFTFFNGINLILVLLVFMTGHFRNALFMLVVIINTAIGIFQEIKAKKTLDKLRFLSKPQATVIRNKQELKISAEELVLNDIVKLKLGDEILSDGEVIEGQVLVNEALLTGESENILKSHGDKLYAGSFITGGMAYMEIKAVGDQNYINHILKTVRKNKKQPSRLRDAMDFIIKSISLIIFPLGIILFAKQFFLSQNNLNEALLGTVASLVGMIPEGLILLTSVALSVGAVKLSWEKTVVNELYSLETLARCNVLCFDKTGTVTTGKLKVIKDIRFCDAQVDDIIANIINLSGDENPTSSALKDYYHSQNQYVPLKIIPFSSNTKKTVMEVLGHTYELGAFDYLNVAYNREQNDLLDKYLNDGYRLLALSDKGKLLAIIIMQDEIRINAAQILDYFKKQDVEIKIISGDNPQTVKNILSQIGLKEISCMDCHNIDNTKLLEAINSSNIFGRVSPDQKSFIIEALKAQGKVVGMVGDGANDVLALKSADFSIAMFNGAKSAKNVANVVLLDNDFSHMPSIVNEGRRVINNIQKSATLFLSKTVLSISLSLLTVLAFASYPFDPIQLTLISSFCIGFPAFCLSFEPNYSIIKGNFLANVLAKALPIAIAVTISVIIVEILKLLSLIDESHLQTIVVIITYLSLLYVLYDICKPFNPWRIAILIIAASGIILAFLWANNFFYLSFLPLHELILSLALSLLTIILFRFLQKKSLASKLAQKLDDQY